MGKQKNTKKRHRDFMLRRRRALLTKYRGIQGGWIQVSDKAAALKAIEAQLERRGWSLEEMLEAEKGQAAETAGS